MTADHPGVDRINALLPQTQCTKCGHPGCKPYAEAIAQGGAINKCPPGGAATIAALAALLQRPVVPLDPAHGVESPRMIAYIREDECIGCTKCIEACPVDAILGSAKHMHTVIVSECTGCDLCVAPCPVDCIDMLVAPTPQRSQLWKARHEAHLQRMAVESALEKQRAASPASTAAKDVVAAALARVQAKKAALRLAPAAGTGDKNTPA
jgi:electron transport complex protein RnfB